MEDMEDMAFYGVLVQQDALITDAYVEFHKKFDFQSKKKVKF